MLSIEKTRIIAKTIGDGCLTSKYLRYCNTCKDLIDEFVGDIEKEYNIKVVTFGKCGSNNTSFAQTQVKRVITDLFNILPSYKSNFVKIPDLIKSTNARLKAEFLRSLFDDEGTAALRYFNKNNEWKREIKICSKSRILIDDIACILVNDFNIITGKIIFSKSVWVLPIFGKSNITIFSDKIGFKHPKKRRLLDLMIESYGATKLLNYNKWAAIHQEMLEIRDKY